MAGHAIGADRRLWRWLVLGCVVGWAVGLLAAGVSAEPVSVPSTEAKPRPEVPHAVYIPYQKLERTFERDGRRVFVSHEQYQRLWQAAKRAEQQQQADADDTGGKPPGAVILSSESVAEVVGEAVRVLAMLRIERLQPGWLAVPLGLEGSAIQRAMLDGEPARVVAGEGKGAGRVLWLKPGGDIGQVRNLRLVYSKAYERSPGEHRVAFAPPRAAVSRWRFTPPSADVSVSVTPSLAVSAGRGERRDEAGDEADGEDEAGGEAGDPGESAGTVEAFVGPTPRVAFAWTARAEGATGLDALVRAEADQDVQVETGVVRSRVRLTYRISRSARSTLSFTTPSRFKLVNVFHANVRRWSVSSVADQPGRQRVDVSLFEPAEGEQPLVLDLERYTPTDAQAAEAAGDDGAKGEPDEVSQRLVTVPTVVAQDVMRQTGRLRVSVAEELEAEVAAQSGLTRVDASSAGGQAGGLAFQYAAAPYTLQLTVRRARPRVSVQATVAAELDPQRLSTQASWVMQIERAGLFSVDLWVPAGHEVESVTLRDASGQAVGISSIQPVSQSEAVEAVEGDEAGGDVGDEGDVADERMPEGRRLRVSFARQARGQATLDLSLRRELNEAGLQRHTAPVASIRWPLPRLIAEGVTQQRGSLRLEAEESLSVQVLAHRGLRSDREGGDDRTHGGKGGPGLRLRYVFAEATEAQADGGPRLELQVGRRPPRVEVRQALQVGVEPGVVRYAATLFYAVSYSGVPHLRLDVPEPLAEQIRLPGTTWRKAVMDPQPDDVAAGDVALRLTGEGEILGQHRVELRWQEPITDLGLGEQRAWTLPRLVPRGVDRSWGQIVLGKAETVDLRPAEPPKGLSAIDPRRDLMPGLSVPEAARAYEFYTPDRELKVRATRYELLAVKTTSVERAAITSVYTGGNTVSLQAVYRLRSAEPRLTVSLPAEAAFANRPARINGNSVTLEKGDADQFFVPLVNQRPDEPFVLELRYSAPATGASVPTPVLGGNPAVQKVYQLVYSPVDQRLVGHLGPWHSEMRWRLDDWQLEPKPLMSRQDLLRWVGEGLVAPSGLDQGFQVDGRMHLFAAMGPPPDGSLRWFAVHRFWLNSGLLLLAVAIAAAGLPARWRGKLLGVAVLVAVAVLLGTFTPTLVRQAVGPMTVAAAVLVLAAWLVYELAFRMPERPTVKEIAAAWREVRQRQAEAAGSDDGAPDEGEGEDDPAQPGEGGNGSDRSDGSDSADGEQSGGEGQQKGGEA